MKQGHRSVQPFTHGLKSQGAQVPIISQRSFVFMSSYPDAYPTIHHILITSLLLLPSYPSEQTMRSSLNGFCCLAELKIKA